jgi:hypothetical protein
MAVSTIPNPRKVLHRYLESFNANDMWETIFMTVGDPYSVSGLPAEVISGREYGTLLVFNANPFVVQAYWDEATHILYIREGNVNTSAWNAWRKIGTQSV